jgi:hypothetical protein
MYRREYHDNNNRIGNYYIMHCIIDILDNLILDILKIILLILIFVFIIISNAILREIFYIKLY